jgi:fatty-acyl-CoA synthase
MSDRVVQHYWPKDLPKTLTLPETSLYENLEISAKRYPNKPFMVFYDTPITFSQLKAQTEDLAGYLQKECGVKKGDRVLLLLQNSPQFIIGYYGILRANAVVVPVNPMNLTAEIEHYIEDTDATTIIAAQNLYDQVQPLLDQSRKYHLKHCIVANYKDYLSEETDLKVPDFIAEDRLQPSEKESVSWADALNKKIKPSALDADSDDLCVMPYTSGTTGKPKGCMHTHRTVMATTVANEVWFGAHIDDVRLAIAPLFHVTGMQGGMNSPIFSGATIVLLPRWDRDVAAKCVEKYKVTGFTGVPQMVIDFLANPNLPKYDITSLKKLSGGGAAMPEAIAKRLEDMGIPFIEGYGLSETIAATHANPIDHPKKQCLGVPIFGVDSRILDPVTFKEMPVGEVGEIFTSGPQVMTGYWRKPEATKETLVEIDGKIFLRTGDLAKIDDEGFFFMVDRLKRMINANGYKVWPAEVESMMYQHPAIQEACIIGVKDAQRGENVKAIVVLKEPFRGVTTEQEILDWAKNNMAAYKAPRMIAFMDILPKSGSGKIMWRKLQEEEAAKNTSA